MIWNFHPKSLPVKAFHSVQIICARRIQLYPSMAPKQIYKRICKTRFPLLLKDVLPSSETRHRLERTTSFLNLFFSALSLYLFFLVLFYFQNIWLTEQHNFVFQFYQYNLDNRGGELPKFNANNNGCLHVSVICRIFLTLNHSIYIFQVCIG